VLFFGKLTPAQLEEFESTFRHFDSDDTNTLEIEEFTAALASLGISYSVRLPFPSSFFSIAANEARVAS
jgi:Ca2+-binding EF-hand superfamily protein